MNLYDFVIVIISLVDVTISNIFFEMNSDFSSHNDIPLVVVKSTRLLRIFKLARNWLRFELLLDTLARTIKDMGPFSMLLAMIVFVYTILGL